MIELMRCPICQEIPCIPVRMVCFPCYHPMSRSCDSIQRICMECAIEYLELHSIPEKRSVTLRKCFFCPATVSLPALTLSTSLQKDFLLLTSDIRKDVKCPFDQCHFQGSHVEVDHHYQSDCMFRMVQCIWCNESYQQVQQVKHQEVCPFFMYCRRCETWIHVSDITSHNAVVHGENRCMHCKDWIPIAHFSHHETVQCPMRPIVCPLCDTSNLVHARLYDHVKNHLQKIENVFLSEIANISLLMDCLQPRSQNVPPPTEQTIVIPSSPTSSSSSSISTTSDSSSTESDPQRDDEEIVRLTTENIVSPPRQQFPFLSEMYRRHPRYPAPRSVRATTTTPTTRWVEMLEMELQHHHPSTTSNNNISYWNNQQETSDIDDTTTTL